MADTDLYSDSDIYTEFSKGPKSIYYGIGDEDLPHSVLNIPQTDDDDEWGRTQRISDERTLDYIAKIYKTLFDPYGSMDSEVTLVPGEANSVINVAKNMALLVGQPGGVTGVFNFTASTLTLGTIVIDGATPAIDIGSGCELTESTLTLENDFIFTGGVSSSTITYEDLSITFNSTTSEVTLSASSTNFVFDAEGYLGLSTDDNLLQFGVGTLTVNGNISMTDSSNIGSTTTSNLLVLGASSLTVNGSLSTSGSIIIGNDQYIGNTTYPNLLKLRDDNEIVELAGDYAQLYINGTSYSLLSVGTSEGRLGIYTDSNLINLTYHKVKFNYDVEFYSTVTFYNTYTKIYNGNYLGTTTDGDLLKLETGQLTLNGNLYLNDGSYIATAGSIDAIRLYSSGGTYYVAINDPLEVSANIKINYSYINQDGISNRGLYFSQDLAVMRVYNTQTSGTNRFTLSMTDETSIATGVGAGICLRGRYLGDSTTEFAGINAYKANATSGNTEAYLCFQTRASSGSLATRLILQSDHLLLNTYSYIGTTTATDLIRLYDTHIDFGVNIGIGGTVGITGAVSIVGTTGITGALTATSLGITNNISVGNDLGVTHDLGVTNNVSIGGTFNVVGNATHSGDITPTSSYSKDLGSSSNLWRYLYTHNIQTSFLYASSVYGNISLAFANLIPNGTSYLGGASASQHFDGVYADNYYPFTGSHLVVVSKGEEIDIEEGMVAISTGEVYIEDFSNTIVEVAPSKKVNDTKVYGIFKKPSDNPADEELKNDSSLIVKLAHKKNYWCVNALGEGQILVVSVDGKEPKNGDLLSTSKIPGYAGVQDDDIFRSCTIGKVTQSINWNEITDYVLYNGQKYKKALIACTYHCG